MGKRTEGERGDAGIKAKVGKEGMIEEYVKGKVRDATIKVKGQ